MIALLNGYVDSVNPEYIVLSVNDVGYKVISPNPFEYEPNAKEKVKVFTYQYVREDMIALYGFKREEERNLFSVLLKVSGIGPKGALAIVASGQPEQVVHAIENEDEAFLVKFPGVGKKTARQMVLDLKGKLGELVGDTSAEAVEKPEVSYSSQNLEDAMEALKVLGYADREIKKLKPILSKEEMSTDQYVKAALKILLSK